MDFREFSASVLLQSSVEYVWDLVTDGALLNSLGVGFVYESFDRHRAQPGTSFRRCSFFDPTKQGVVHVVDWDPMRLFSFGKGSEWHHRFDLTKKSNSSTEVIYTRRFDRPGFWAKFLDKELHSEEEQRRLVAATIQALRVGMGSRSPSWDLYESPSGYPVQSAQPPMSRSLRFVEQQDNTIIDHLTGLMWMKTLLGSESPDSKPNFDWIDATQRYGRGEYLDGDGFGLKRRLRINSITTSILPGDERITFAGFADWRLPTAAEFFGLSRRDSAYADKWLEPHERPDERISHPLFELYSSPVWCANGRYTATAWKVRAWMSEFEVASKDEKLPVFLVRNVGSAHNPVRVGR